MMVEVTFGGGGGGGRGRVRVREREREKVGGGEVVGRGRLFFSLLSLILFVVM